MLVNVAYVLAGLVGVGIFVIGVRAFWVPQAAVGFGIPDTPVEDRNFQAWLSVKSVRDVVSGIFIFVLMVGAPVHLLGWFMLAAAAIPVGDGLIVLRSGGSKAAAYGIHGATALVILVSSVILLVA
ncbi:DUF4267 domain-containing protein [Umezawaea endophytica]|uniref:DUF4267 domain-containing protein n=1 Tax=Umezawaea endophytica TaxID=1654476 RepID=A0A9X2VPL5_9PSEU|nr:DUF4267 domain-containing protein [Umezawaea endophytica]MCS7480177.1 DUF4267 domain-containing protein [Umezawaea endophytica]